jgi:hypothetical protein
MRSTIAKLGATFDPFRLRELRSGELRVDHPAAGNSAGFLLNLALDKPAAFRVEDAARHERAARRPAQQITAGGVAAFDEADDRAWDGVPLEPEQFCAAAPPGAGSLAPFGEAVVEAVPEGLLVVGGASEVHRRHAQHDDGSAAISAFVNPRARRQRTSRLRAVSRLRGPQTASLRA